MAWWRKLSPRRAEAKRQRLENSPGLAQRIRSAGVVPSIVVALGFFLVGCLIVVPGSQPMAYRVSDFVSHDLIARVEFQFRDVHLLTSAQHEARERVPQVYSASGDSWSRVEELLLDLPTRLAGKTVDQVPDWLREQFRSDAFPVVGELDAAALTMLQQFGTESGRAAYEQKVRALVQPLRGVVVIPADQLQAERRRRDDSALRRGGALELRGPDGATRLVEIDRVTASGFSPELMAELRKGLEREFRGELQAKLAAYVINNLQPTHALNEEATAQARNVAAANVPVSRSVVSYKAGQTMVRKGQLTPRDWSILQAEHDAFLASLPWAEHAKQKASMVIVLVMLTLLLAGYVRYYQPRIVVNHARAVALAVLLLAMLLLTRLAGLSTVPLMLFGVAPTLLVAMILAIGYDRRFAIGLSSIFALLSTMALGESVGFLLVQVVGIFVCCTQLDDIRSRSKLVEVGGLTGCAMMLAALGTQALSLNHVAPLWWIGLSSLYAGAAGLSVGFIVLGILPFIEKSFRITTSLTLLELADVSHPLLRKLALDAPGTYNHSLQVATLAEAVAEAIDANSLLCRVGAYYHDVGKVNKPGYYIENQEGGENRHLNLLPSVSALIILEHVKHGVELAREYRLPTRLIPFIQEHHGTTLVEYFYRQAEERAEKGTGEEVSEEQYRYPGPKPRTRETAIVMLADCVESACRSMSDPSGQRIEAMVDEMVSRRIADGQLDDSGLTMGDLALVRKTLCKALIAIYHGRIAYPAAPAGSRGQAVKTG